MLYKLNGVVVELIGIENTFGLKVLVGSQLVMRELMLTTYVQKIQLLTQRVVTYHLVK